MRTRSITWPVVAVLALAACTGEPTSKTYSDPMTWANTYCASTLKANSAAREVVALDPADPVRYKESLLKLQATAAEAYSESARQLDELGPPGPDAEAAHKDLVESVRNAAEYATRFEARLRAIEPDAELQANLEKLVASLTDLSAIPQVQDIVQAFPAKYLDALHNAPTCVEMRDNSMVNPPTR